MGSSLGPVHANIIMTELESQSYRIVEPLIASGKIKFYIQNVDDTLLLLPIMGDRDCCVCLEYVDGISQNLQRLSPY